MSREHKPTMTQNQDARIKELVGSKRLHSIPLFTEKYVEVFTSKTSELEGVEGEVYNEGDTVRCFELDGKAEATGVETYRKILDTKTVEGRVILVLCTPEIFKESKVIRLRLTGKHHAAIYEERCTAITSRAKRDYKENDIIEISNWQGEDPIRVKVTHVSKAGPPFNPGLNESWVLLSIKLTDETKMKKLTSELPSLIGKEGKHITFSTKLRKA